MRSRDSDRNREDTVVWEDVASFVREASVEAELADGCIAGLRFSYPRGADPGSGVEITAEVRRAENSPPRWTERVLDPLFP